MIYTHTGTLYSCKKNEEDIYELTMVCFLGDSTELSWGKNTEVQKSVYSMLFFV